MDHSLPLITTLVGGFVLAYILGMFAQRLKISPMVGYLAAGVISGPFTPGYVADMKLVPELAELGVILLMFGVGLHFSFRDLMSVTRIAIPGAIAGARSHADARADTRADAGTFARAYADADAVGSSHSNSRFDADSDAIAVTSTFVLKSEALRAQMGAND